MVERAHQAVADQLVQLGIGQGGDRGRLPRPLHRDLPVDAPEALAHVLDQRGVAGLTDREDLLGADDYHDCEAV